MENRNNFKTYIMEFKLNPKTLVAMGEFIAVVDNGFVFHGDVTYDGDFYLISHAKNIRVWGTKNGLGELRNGQTPNTVADESGEILIPKGRLCHLIQANWKR
jgi:hypothetical protein